MPNTVITRQGAEIMMQPAGDMVAAAAPDLRDAMREEIAGGAREITLDLCHVQMVDSAGIGLIIATHNSLARVGGRLAVTHASREILDLFRTMRIHQHLSVSGD